jgi:hypothetical protein
MRLNGQDGRVELQPGDELIIVLGEPARSSAQSAVTPGSPSSTTDAPSAMSRGALLESDDAVQADQIPIFRRRQSP